MDTTLLREADRFDFWHELVAQESAPARIDSPHLHNFDASAWVTELGGVRLSTWRYPALSMYRTAKLIRSSDPEMYHLALPLSGHGAMTQERRESALRPGAFAFIDTSRPHVSSHGPSSSARRLTSTITVLVPHSALSLPTGKISQLLGSSIPSGSGMGALLAQFLLQVTRHPEQFRPRDAHRLGDIALDLISAMIAQRLDIESVLPADVRHQALRARVDDFIRRNLGDPELTPRMVAAAQHISIRTLYRLFAGEETTVAELIRTRRLERCRRDLADGIRRDQPVRVIGARWGFRDKAHFSRAFRARYGISPQAYRDQADPTSRP